MDWMEGYDYEFEVDDIDSSDWADDSSDYAGSTDFGFDDGGGDWMSSLGGMFGGGGGSSSGGGGGWMGLLMGGANSYMQGQQDKDKGKQASKNSLAQIAASGEQDRLTLAEKYKLEEALYQAHGKQLADAMGGYAQYQEKPSGSFGLLSQYPLQTRERDGRPYENGPGGRNYG